MEIGEWWWNGEWWNREWWNGKLGYGDRRMVVE